MTGTSAEQDFVAWIEVSPRFAFAKAPGRVHALTIFRARGVTRQQRGVRCTPCFLSSLFSHAMEDVSPSKAPREAEWWRHEDAGKKCVMTPTASTSTGSRTGHMLGRIASHRASHSHRFHHHHAQVLLRERTYRAPLVVGRTRSA